jgi:hypothetical protein
MVEAPRFQDNRHTKVVRVSALHTGRLYPTGNIPGTHFCYRLSRLQGHITAGRILSMKNSSDTIGNRSRYLPACSTVPQPTAPPRAPLHSTGWFNTRHITPLWTTSMQSTITPSTMKGESKIAPTIITSSIWFRCI